MAARCWQDWPQVELPTLSDGAVTLRPRRLEDAGDAKYTVYRWRAS
jgi:hypothetical protein